jgi:Na+-driven multidrug efflux pump
LNDYILRITRVEGKNKASAVIGVLPIFLLILFDSLFMIVPDGSLGVNGAGASFIMAYAVTLLIIAPYIIKIKRSGESNLFPSFKTSKMDSDSTFSILKAGSPVF